MRFKIIITIMIIISYVLFTISLGLNIILGLAILILIDTIWNERGL